MVNMAMRLSIRELRFVIRRKDNKNDVKIVLIIKARFTGFDI